MNPSDSGTTNSEETPILEELVFESEDGSNELEDAVAFDFVDSDGVEIDASLEPHTQQQTKTQHEPSTMSDSAKSAGDSPRHRAPLAPVELNSIGSLSITEQEIEVEPLDPASDDEETFDQFPLVDPSSPSYDVLPADVDSDDEERATEHRDQLADSSADEEEEDAVEIEIIEEEEEVEAVEPDTMSSSHASPSQAHFGLSFARPRNASPPFAAFAHDKQQRSTTARDPTSSTLRSPTAEPVLDRPPHSRKRSSFSQEEQPSERGSSQRSPQSSQLQRSQSAESPHKLRGVVSPSNSQNSTSTGSTATLTSSQGSSSSPVLPQPQPSRLTPISLTHPITGLPLTDEERSAAIIEKFELLAVSHLEQVCDDGDLLEAHLGPEPPPDESADQNSQPSQSSQGSKRKGPKKKKVKPKPVRLVMQFANRASPGAMRSVAWPSKRGKGDTAAANAKTVLCYLRVIEFIVEGLRSNTTSTKRDLFYRDSALFGSQAVVDSIVEDLAASLGVRRSHLNITAASKGLFGGCLKITTKDGVTLEGGSRGALTPPTEQIEEIDDGGARWVLVVEKEAVFHSLCSADFYLTERIGPGILLTGKGYPDVVSRELLHRLDRTVDASVPLLALVDCDPYGLTILSTYKAGSKGMTYDEVNLVVPRLEWLGVKGTECDEFGLDRDALIALTERDRTRANNMLKEEGVEREVKRELGHMLECGLKAEIEILSAVRPAPRRDEQAQENGEEVGALGQPSQPFIDADESMPAWEDETLTQTQTQTQHHQDENLSPLWRYLFTKIEARLAQ